MYYNPFNFAAFMLQISGFHPLGAIVLDGLIVDRFPC